MIFRAFKISSLHSRLVNQTLWVAISALWNHNQKGLKNSHLLKNFSLLHFSAPCYAEYRARWPRVAGSPYEYTYLSIGEGVAFLLGVIHFLQVVTMAATGGRAASQSLDLMLNNRILNKTRQHLGAIDAFHSTPDLIGGAFVLIVTVAVATGVQRHQQKVVTFFANSISILLILFCAIVGLFHMRFDLWHSPKDFFPRGYAGVSWRFLSLNSRIMSLYSVAFPSF